MFRRLAGVLFIFFIGTSCAFAQQDKVRLEVITTLFPTYDFARQVGGEKVNVFLLLPPGVEAHAFEPKPQDVVRINKADVFIYTGRYMEPWVEDLLKGVSNKKLVVVDSSRGIDLMDERDHDEDDHDEEEEGGHHHHGGKDPHIWLDLANAQIMVDNIAGALAEKDPANNDFYLENAREYKIKLADLDRRFKETLATAKHKTIIYGGHFAFGYFAKRYGLEYDSPYEGFSPNAEPSPRAIAELIDKLNASGIKYIYYEELLDPKVARAIAQETGARLELLHGAHNLSKDGLKKGVTFLDVMEDNLKKLKAGLECR
ncbi:MAG: zinc ABC transporter substrate-binding protein [Candidatus Omnitrophica bacterium]|nr:zinc ABC transporter substrate-binding protein [Candidatus Omnitrophota bacterium]MDD5042341.1 zinc ABC transporter substrate-binding protein [Candidatus Omnitrophota bacterium]MDD5500898.1 zinc ABC transporter substrate-binding protein [Candidatus Omnitrophota bacterium]